MLFSLFAVREAKLASARHQIVPVMVKLIPSNINGSKVFLKAGSMN